MAAISLRTLIIVAGLIMISLLSYMLAYFMYSTTTTGMFTLNLTYGAQGSKCGRNNLDIAFLYRDLAPLYNANVTLLLRTYNGSTATFTSSQRVLHRGEVINFCVSAGYSNSITSVTLYLSGYVYGVYLVSVNVTSEVR